VLSEVNGTPVRNLRHLVEILRDSREEQLAFKFASAGVLTHETIVFNRADLIDATGKILEDNGIRYPYSADLRKVWQQPPETAGRESVQTACCAAPVAAH
jgi:hypothetical protein